MFWGHTQSLAEAKKKRAAAADGAKQRGWVRFAVDVVELVESDA